jgi:hypothetical protein
LRYGRKVIRFWVYLGVFLDEDAGLAAC